MSIDQYWPSADRVDSCIKSEAETASVPVLLAVHQPTALTTRNAGTNIETPATEEQLLETFLSDHVPGGYLLAPVTGPSGFGKSHVIRWLDAQLRRSAKADSLHIIRIPKSASLRKVVELILEPLKDDPRYAKARSDLTRAVSEVDGRSAIVLFRAQLENALAVEFAKFEAEAREHRERGPELRPLMGHARSLPQLFSDAALAEHFADKVLSRVVSRALKGRSEAEVADDTDSQFRESDLIIPDDVPLNQAAQTVRTYYQTSLAVADPTRRRAAVDLLNAVVDTAIGNVFQLEQSTGGLTLQDIILGVREILFEDGRDLVLLIEDFAALAGIQDVLLKVCIQEGEYEGKKVRATMRTALALTDGYLTSRDTILTRAQRVWVLGSRQTTDEEVKASVVDLAGAYLNAARWGEAELKTLFENRGARGLTSWLSTWRDTLETDADTETLEAFGFSSAGHPLFPFNRAALEQLAERHLREQGRLVMNPRRIINEILRDTLLLRPIYQANAFPPAEFQRLRPGQFSAEWISERTATDQVKRRLGVVFAAWGGNPLDERSVARLPPALFSAFSLPSPSELSSLKYEPKERESQPDPKKPERGQPGERGVSEGEKPFIDHAGSDEAAEDPEVAEWSRRLEDWAQDKVLTQTEGRDLRKAFVDLLSDAMDWPALRVRRQEIRPNWLVIAGTRNNPTVGRKLVVCDTQKDDSGVIRAAFLGAIRFSRHGHWNYRDADRDYVATSMIVDSLRAQLTQYVLEDTTLQAAAVARALITQARVAGLEPPTRPTSAEGLVRALFDPINVDGTALATDPWETLQQHAFFYEGRPVRSVLQEVLLDRVGSFQGTGTRPFAIDMPRLLEVLSRDAGASAPEGLPYGLSSYLPNVSDRALWQRLQPIISLLRTFHEEVGGFIDEGFDKNDFVADLKEVVHLLQEAGAWPSGIRLADYEPQVTEFQTKPVVQLVTNAATVVAEADREQMPKLLNAVGAMDLRLIQRTTSFLGLTKQLFDLAEPRIIQEEAARSQSDPAAVANDITALLQVMSGLGEPARTSA